MKRNVLIFHLGALGDFLLTWPLAMGLSRIHPQSRIIYITHRQKGLLAERVLGVESADIEAGWHHLFGNPAALPDAGRNMLVKAHSIYSFICSPDDAWTQHARAIAGIDICCLRPTPPAEFPHHVTDYVLDQLAIRPAAAQAMRQMIASIQHQGIRRTSAGSTIIIHPGSGSVAKCWPAESYLDLARRLTDAGRAVRVVLGEIELDRWPAERIAQFEQFAPVVRPASLLDLLNAFTDAGAYIGNDSGPTHLAGMLGLRCVCLFGPTSPATWRPLGPDVRVLARMPLERISVDEVVSELESTPPPSDHSAAP